MEFVTVLMLSFSLFTISFKLRNLTRKHGILFLYISPDKRHSVRIAVDNKWLHELLVLSFLCYGIIPGVGKSKGNWTEPHENRSTQTDLASLCSTKLATPGGDFHVLISTVTLIKYGSLQIDCAVYTVLCMPSSSSWQVYAPRDNTETNCHATITFQTTKLFI